MRLFLFGQGEGCLNTAKAFVPEGRIATISGCASAPCLICSTYIGNAAPPGGVRFVDVVGIASPQTLVTRTLVTRHVGGIDEPVLEQRKTKDK